MGAGESEFDSRDPDFRMGRHVPRWRLCLASKVSRVRFPSAPPGSSEVARSILAAVAERMRREFPKLVDAGSNPAGSSARARVAQGKSDTRGEGLMRVQISSRAPSLRRKAEGGRQKAEGGRRKAEGRRQKAEGGRQKAEGGRQKAEGGRQKE